MSTNPMFVRSETKFTPSRRFRPSSPASLFIDALIALCKGNPPYVRPEDSLRHQTLLPQLANFECTEEWDEGFPTCKVGNISIARIEDALEQWVRSYLRRAYKGEVHRMMPHFALDTAEFVRKHLQGYYSHGGSEMPPFSIGPMMEGGSHKTIFKPYFKRDFTCCSRASVKGVVPEGAEIKMLWHPSLNSQTLAPGGSFLFLAERCHLSTSWSENVHAEAAEPVRMDISEEFMLYGTLWMPTSNDESQQVGAYISPRWFTHVRDSMRDVWLPITWEKPA